MKKILIIFVILLSACSKDEPEIPQEELNVKVTFVWYYNCNPPETNTAIITLNAKEYVLDLTKNGTSYEGVLKLKKGHYNASLKELEGMHAMKKTGDLNGAVVIPESFPINIKEGVNLTFQVFCDQ